MERAPLEELCRLGAGLEQNLELPPDPENQPLSPTAWADHR